MSGPRRGQTGRRSRPFRGENEARETNETDTPNTENYNDIVQQLKRSRESWMEFCYQRNLRYRQETAILRRTNARLRAELKILRKQLKILQDKLAWQQEGSTGEERDDSSNEN